MRQDEKEAIISYEDQLFLRHNRGSSSIYTSSDAHINDRLSIAIFKHLIENIMRWTPREAYAALNYDLIKDLGLINVWNNLDKPREINQYKNVKYIVARLYPKKFMQLFSTEALTLCEYRSVMENRNGLFPKNYFYDQEGKKKSQICLIYALEYYIVYETMEDAYKEFANKEIIEPVLKHCGLLNPCKILYDTPLDYLHETLSNSRQGGNDLLYNYYKFTNNLKSHQQ